MQQVDGGHRQLAQIEFREAHRGVGIDEVLGVDATDALECADEVRVDAA